MAVDLTKMLALHASAFPQLGWADLIETAGRLGYAGVHLQLLPTPGRELASDLTNAEPAEVKAALEKAGLVAVCLETGVALHYRQKETGEAAMRLGIKAINFAAEVGAKAISVHPGAVLLGERPVPVFKRISERGRRLAERAAEVGVRLVYENAGYFATAKPMWGAIEATDHSNCGVCWNAATALVEGEITGVSLNALNFRLALLKLQDGVVEDGGLRQLPLGEGDVNLERLLQIASGIGYEGYLSVVWDRQADPTLAEGEEVAAAAVKLITEILRPKLDKKGQPLTNREAKFLEFDPVEEARLKAEKAEKAKAKAEAAAEK